MGAAGWATQDCEWLYECLHDWWMSGRRLWMVVRMFPWLSFRAEAWQHMYKMVVSTKLKLLCFCNFISCIFKGVLTLLVTAGITRGSLIVDPPELIIGDNKPHHVIFSCRELLKVNFIKWRKMSVILSLIIILWMNVAVVSFCGPTGSSLCLMKWSDKGLQSWNFHRNLHYSH